MLANLPAANLDHLACVIKRGLKKIKYRPHLIDGCPPEAKGQARMELDHYLEHPGSEAAEGSWEGELGGAVPRDPRRGGGGADRRHTEGADRG